LCGGLEEKGGRMIVVRNKECIIENDRQFLSNPTKPSPPPLPPKPSRQALNLFVWRQKQELELERIRRFGHDSRSPPARPPKGELEDAASSTTVIRPLKSVNNSKTPLLSPLNEKDVSLSHREMQRMMMTPPHIPPTWNILPHTYLETSQPLLPLRACRSFQISPSISSSHMSSPSIFSTCDEEEEIDPPLPKPVIHNRFLANNKKQLAVLDQDVIVNVEQKKTDLAEKIRKRIEDSEDKKIQIINESIANDEVGASLQYALSVSGFASISDVKRFRDQVDEVEKVVSLLLCLAVRLARTERQVGGQVTEKRHKLLCQLEEAKCLKRRIDRRGVAVGDRVGEFLGEGKKEEYWAFLRNKERLVIERRGVEERLRLSREQLMVLL